MASGFVGAGSAGRRALVVTSSEALSAFAAFRVSAVDGLGRSWATVTEPRTIRTPSAWSGVSCWPSAIQPSAVATTGLSSARNVTLRRGERTDAAKPERVGEGGSDDREVGVAGEVGRRQRRRWRPSTASATGAATRPPATSCQPVVASSGAGDGQRLLSTIPVAITAAAPNGGGDADARPALVPPRSTSRPTPTTPAAPAMTTRGATSSPRNLPESADDQQRLHRDDGRGDATRKPICGDEQQREERADIQRSEHDRAPPPGAVRQSSGQRDEHESGRESADHGSQQRTPRREQLAGRPGTSCPRSREPARSLR